MQRIQEVRRVHLPALERDGRFLPRHRGRELPHARWSRPHLRRGTAPRARRRHRHRPHPGGDSRPPPPRAALSPAARPRPLRARSHLGRRRSLPPRLPRAPHRAAAARRRARAEAPGRPHHVPAARSEAAGMGDLGGRGARGRPVRADQQDTPLHGRRHLGRGPDVGDPRRYPRCPGGESEPWQPAPHPSGARLVLDAALRRAAQPGEALRAVYSAATAPRTQLRTLTEAARGLAQTFAPALSPVSRTPLNVEVGPHRRLDWTAMRVADLKAVKNVLGGTLNDVVLATVSGALRSFFTQRGVHPEGLTVRALVPVSVRSQDERGALGNRVTQMTASLPVGQADPGTRLAAVRATTAGLKESRQALGGEVLTAISE